jgi:hypothetical protein
MSVALLFLAFGDFTLLASSFSTKIATSSFWAEIARTIEPGGRQVESKRDYDFHFLPYIQLSYRPPPQQIVFEVASS